MGNNQKMTVSAKKKFKRLTENDNKDNLLSQMQDNSNDNFLWNDSRTGRKKTSKDKWAEKKKALKI